MAIMATMGGTPADPGRPAARGAGVEGGGVMRWRFSNGWASDCVSVALIPSIRFGWFFDERWICLEWLTFGITIEWGG